MQDEVPDPAALCVPNGDDDVRLRAQRGACRGGRRAGQHRRAGQRAQPAAALRIDGGWGAVMHLCLLGLREQGWGCPS